MSIVGLRLDKVERHLGHHGDGLLPEVSIKLTPDLSRPRFGGHMRVWYGHANTSRVPRVISCSLQAVYGGRHAHVVVCEVWDHAPAGGGDRQGRRSDGAPGGPI